MGKPSTTILVIEYDNTIPLAVLAAGLSCGECAMCCKLPKIDALQKPANQWCVHSPTRKSCDAWDARPQHCQSFFCHFMENKAMGEEWRPSNARFMIMGRDNGKTMLIVVDPDRPDAWKRKPFFQQLGIWSRTFKVLIHIGDKQMQLRGELLSPVSEIRN